MSVKTVDELKDSLKEGVADTKSAVKSAVVEMAEKIEDVLEDASYEGRHMKKKVQAELVKRWRQVDEAGRENAFVMAVGALGVGILIGYLIGRDRD